MSDLTWAEQTITLHPEDHAVRAIEDNPGWRLIAAGCDSAGRTILTYGWPWPGSQECGCYAACERPEACPRNP